MKFVYKPAGSNPTNEFLIHFTFEHGDADATTTWSKRFAFPREELGDFLDCFQGYVDQIENNRSYGTELPADFEETANYKGMTIPMELDSYAKMHMRNYYAAMDIVKIEYFDSEGNKFLVEREY